MKPDQYGSNKTGTQGGAAGSKEGDWNKENQGKKMPTDKDLNKNKTDR